MVRLSALICVLATHKSYPKIYFSRMSYDRYILKKDCDFYCNEKSEKLR